MYKGLEQFVQKGINYSYLWVDKYYEKAVSLYHLAGFKSDGVRNEIYVKD